jgi:dTDP-glucose pyrophosphorylase
MNKVVVLAAGRGTRMRREVPGVRLDKAQERLAAQGLKGLIPIHGHPYLDYVISAAADAGLCEVCLVVGPGSDAIRAHYQSTSAERVRIEFAVQREPLGSAHALLAAELFAGDDPFLVINSDNYYPARTLAALRELRGGGMAGFQSRLLVSEGSIPEERVAAYAVVTTDAEGYLVEIIEKPDASTLGRPEVSGRGRISMNCWRFGASIFAACRSIAPSARGEYELPDAVLHAVRRLGERFRVVPSDEAVLDLSSREDVASVAARLRGRVVCL